MHVPGHVCALYVATCGQNGPGLGTDEKEIILLGYVIIDAATTKIVGVQQYLVRPVGQLGKDQPTQTTAIEQQQQQQQQQSSTPSSSLLSLSNSQQSPTLLSTSPPQQSLTNSVSHNNVQQQQQSSQPQQTQPVVNDGTTNSELPIGLAQAAGKPLNEVIDQFDNYVRSLQIDPESQNFRFITDGQLPLRQCLHPEACAKDIELPSYYCRFSDLRKEFVRYKSADLSKALVPVKDIKKLTQMPTLPPQPLSIEEMVKELDLKTYEDPEFYVKESRDMVSVIQALLATGHKFEANEIITLNLEPGICSIDDEIDGSCIVRARGLPWQSSDQDIAKFFRGLNVAKGGVALCLSAQGRRNGEALVRFVSQEHRDLALKRHKHHIGNRYIEVYRATGEDFLAVAGGASNEAQAFLSKGAQVIIRMRGLPYDCTAKQVLDFFTTGEESVHVLDGVDGVLFVKKPDGRATGDAFVLFANESDAPKALSKHRESIGQRYIELFRSTTAEVQQVLNRSMSVDSKILELPTPPLLPPIPAAVPMQLLSQHVITSGNTKNCIRLRGLPYEARVEHILHFLDDFAKNIIYQGVHMIYNAQGQPSGEAFIQMDLEESARLCAQQKHNQFMVFGKKYRYIEVFQCSGDDINLIINGGLQSPVSPAKPALLSPGGTIVGHHFSGFAPFGTTILPPLPPHRAHPAFYPQPFVYWGYPSPPVSPTTYFGPVPAPPPPPPHVAANLAASQHQPTLQSSCAPPPQVRQQQQQQQPQPLHQQQVQHNAVPAPTNHHHHHHHLQHHISAHSHAFSHHHLQQQQQQQQQHHHQLHHFSVQPSPPPTAAAVATVSSNGPTATLSVVSVSPNIPPQQPSIANNNFQMTPHLLTIDTTLPPILSGPPQSNLHEKLNTPRVLTPIGPAIATAANQCVELYIA